MMRLVLAILMIIACKNGFAQSESIATTVDKSSVLIGEPFHLTIELSFNARGKGNFISIDSIPHFEVLQKSRPDTVRAGKSMKVQQTITLTSWDSGKWAIPAVANGNAKSKAIPITVSFTPFDASKPYHDIKSIIEVKKPEESSWYWYLIGILFFAGLFFLFFFRGEHKAEASQEVSAANAFQVAIRKLEQLASDAGSRAEAKLFYTRLIDIFREYARNRKGIQSYSKTTYDLVTQLNKMPLGKDQFEQLSEVLQLSDMVKFARFVPQEQEMEDSFQAIKKSITAMEHLK